MLSSNLGNFIMTFLISMIPVIELRLGLPYGIMSGLKLPVAALAAILGNMLPVPLAAKASSEDGQLYYQTGKTRRNQAGDG